MFANAFSRSRFAAILVVLSGFTAACGGVADVPAQPKFERVSDDQVAHGERLSSVLGCIGCHTLDLTGEDWSDPELGVLWTANLTQSGTRFSAEELSAMIVEGKHPDRSLIDMPSFLFMHVHTDDIDALVAYIQSLEPAGNSHPEPTIGPKLAAEIASGEFLDAVELVATRRDDWPPDAGPEHQFGRYIARSTCFECHGTDLRGEIEQMSDFPPRPDLRMVAFYEAEDFVTLMRTGKAPGDRELTVMSGVARHRYSRFTDAEIDALYAYLVKLAEDGL